MTSTSGKQDIKNNNEITCNLKSKAEGKKDWLIFFISSGDIDLGKSSCLPNIASCLPIQKFNQNILTRLLCRRGLGCSARLRRRNINFVVYIFNFLSFLETKGNTCVKWRRIPTPSGRTVRFTYSYHLRSYPIHR